MRRKETDLNRLYKVAIECKIDKVIETYIKPRWCSRALEKSADSFSKIAYRIPTHIIYIFGRIM
jgi:phosphate uptake regulator